MSNEEKRMNENAKQEQLDSFRVSNDGKKLTTNQGLKVSEDEHSLKAGVRGPTLMEDFHFREKMTHFDHERIPERIVHARGFGAHGYFQVYEPLTSFTKAKFLQDPSVKTPVFVRFSTVAGSRGSSDTVRDVRGFSTKFYTEEGNYDLVGNNIPVFFIQDAMKFPDFVHAVKPEPHNEVPQASSAHDTFWDFIANNHESAHMMMWAMSDRALPRSYRMMEGFGVHTFRLVNEEGVGHFVKFHWKPVLGVHSLVWDENQKVAGKDPDFHRRDLWNAIETGNYPEYELGLQIIKEEDEFSFDFDILDPTKIWPEEIVPVRRVGKMTLNRNTDNFFAETEQIAFHPGHVVPGIDFSNDPLLQGRLFSYTDTQISRLGGPNFPEIPINRPVAPVHNNQRDGMHRMTINQGPVSYHKNSIAGNTPSPASPQEGGYQHYAEKVEGHKIKARSSSFEDFYSQALLFWNSMSEPEKKHLISAFQFELGKVQRMEVRQQVIHLLMNIAPELASAVAPKIGAQLPESAENPAKPPMIPSSPAISMANTIHSAKTRKVAVLAGDGFDQHVITLINALTEAGVMAEVVSDHLGPVSGQGGVSIEAMHTFLTSDSLLFDAIYVAGGEQSVQAISADPNAAEFIKEAYRHYKPIGALNEGVSFLVKGLGMASDSAAASAPGIVTAASGEELGSFAEKFLNAVAAHRFWDRVV
ncbi:catalase [Paenibacillus sp. 453mf]|uniref:catalase n=1 Tax=Paenibacillus sp. 453mf TaxID=1761874 RepID=UPI0008E65494|nr:catalase [Paenibacillus sp. 453mf]SFS77543.1 catalase [Paenibacillus sp. 453mf]